MNYTIVTTEDFETKIYLLTIYDKGEQKNISKKEIEQLKEINEVL